MDANTVMIEALRAAVVTAWEDGRISEELYEHYRDNEPVSHVFTPNFAEEPWDEDDVAAILAVGEADVAAKLRYLTEIVNQLPA